MSHLVDDQIINLKVIINGFFEEIIDISKKRTGRGWQRIFFAAVRLSFSKNFPIFQ